MSDEPPDEAPPPRARPVRKAAAKKAAAAGKAAAARKAAPARKAAAGKAVAAGKATARKAPARKAAAGKAGAGMARRVVARKSVARKSVAKAGAVWPPEPDDGGGPADARPPAPPPPPQVAPAPPVRPPPPAAPGWAPPTWSPPVPTYTPPSGGLDPLAVTALVLGIVALPLFIFFVPALLAVVLGLLGRRNIRREAGRSGKGMATAGIVLGALSLAGAIVSIVAFGIFDDEGGDSLRYTALQPGLCYDNDYFDERNVELRPCEEDHRREAFAVVEHPAESGSTYPGAESLRRFGQRECIARFQEYVGRAYEDSRLRIVVVFPTRDEWVAADFRDVVCAVARRGDEDLDRSVRGTGV